jgi:hypothetical protein
MMARFILSAALALRGIIVWRTLERRGSLNRAMFVASMLKPL